MYGPFRLFDGTVRPVIEFDMSVRRLYEKCFMYGRVGSCTELEVGEITRKDDSLHSHEAEAARSLHRVTYNMMASNFAQLGENSVENFI